MNYQSISFLLRLFINEVNSFVASFNEFFFILNDINNIDNCEDFKINKHTSDLSDIMLEFFNLSISLSFVLDSIKIGNERFIIFNIKIWDFIVNNLTQDSSLRIYINLFEFNLLSSNSVNNWINVLFLFFLAGLLEFKEDILRGLGLWSNRSCLIFNRQRSNRRFI